MITYAFLDEIKEKFPLILSRKLINSVDIDDMAIDYNASLEDELNKQLMLLKDKTNLFSEACECGDEIAVKSFLLEMRTHAMSLSGFFDAIAEDATLLIKADGWPDIPEDYQLPDHYNYPNK